MSVFKINFDKLNLLLLPTMLRRGLMYGLSKALTAPFKTIYGRFLARRAEVLFALRYDSGKYSIERYLNKAFSDGGNDIYITNAERPQQAYLPQFLTFYLHDVDDYGAVERKYLTQYLPFYIDGMSKRVDFTVHIPSSLHASAESIRSAVAGLALPSYTFDIVEY